MRPATLLTFAIAAALSFSEVTAETNAERMRRGLPPLPPARRGTPVKAAKGSTPSLSPSSSSCSSGTVQCCSVLGLPSDGFISSILQIVGATAPGPGMVGLSCQPFQSGTTQSCLMQTVCCQGSTSDGTVSMGCTAVHL
ncbi:hypothetical protein BDN72DRAFT_459850 [Pluteus cervinus]|uniref:Uncharacterized protein n=1 Tax=Pluteus cervinus TaxID=181527 RepID=A0ACD3A807_9AGAR|nr:hypothetical protein BDN72DRAFT_459850 [Pluteus cervinus]